VDTTGTESVVLIYLVKNALTFTLNNAKIQMLNLLEIFSWEMPLNSILCMDYRTAAFP